MHFLTEIDPRAAVAGSRDPLGLQPIWSALGREVVGNLTTVTTSVRGFTTLILGLYFADEIVAAGNKEIRVWRRQGDGWSFQSTRLADGTAFALATLAANQPPTLVVAGSPLQLLPQAAVVEVRVGGSRLPRRMQGAKQGGIGPLQGLE